MRLKDLVDLRNIKTERTDLPYIALENIVSWEGTFTPSEIQTEGTNARYFAGDVLFGKLRPYLAKAYIPQNDGICSTEFLVMKPKKVLNSKYLQYYLLSPDFIGYIKNQVAGVKMPRTNWTEIGNLTVDFPSRVQQDTTVTYLDQQLNVINKRICLRERELQTLIKLKQSEINSVVTCGLNPSVPLKDSGVDWIGDIPAHWEIRRIKDVFRVVSGNGFKIELQGNESGDYPFCKASDLNGEGIYVDAAKNWVSEAVAMQEHYNIIKPNSILFPKIGESLKKNHRKVNRVSCIVDNNCAALVNYTKNNTLYFYYVSKLINMGDFNNGGAVPSVDMASLLSYPIPFPPIKEQEQIVSYIQNKLEAIDKIVTNINAQIDKLKQLKKSLINEVISGQRPVI